MKKLKIPSSLTVGMSDEEIDTYDSAYRGSSITLKLIKRVLERNLDSLLKEDEKDSMVKDPSINSRLLRNLGRRAELRKIINMLPKNTT